MNDDQKQRILADITNAAKTASRATARLDDLYVQADLAGASLREIAAATEGRASHQTIANRLAAMQTKNGESQTFATAATARSRTSKT